MNGFIFVCGILVTLFELSIGRFNFCSPVLRAVKWLAILLDEMADMTTNRRPDFVSQPNMIDDYCARRCLPSQSSLSRVFAMDKLCLQWIQYVQGSLA